MNFDQKSDKLLMFLNNLLLLLVLLIVTYPLYFVVIASISDPGAVNSGFVWLWPRGLTFEGYKYVLEYDALLTGYRNTIILTLLGTAVNLAVTFTGAYALSKTKLPGMRLIMFILTLSMYFSGGLIPTYILVSRLGLRNTFWALILPAAASMYNVIITRTYFLRNIPEELMQSARIDGCSEFRVFRSIVLPLSAPIIATMALFYGVGHWNQFFQALIYISNKRLYPLQLILRDLLLTSSTAITDLLQGGSASGGNMQYIAQALQRVEILKYAVIIVSSLPLLLIYPFLQRYFMKGIMAGSLKG